MKNHLIPNIPIWQDILRKRDVCLCVCVCGGGGGGALMWNMEVLISTVSKSKHTDRNSYLQLSDVRIFFP